MVELVASGNATWPEHTGKSLLDEEGAWEKPFVEDWGDEDGSIYFPDSIFKIKGFSGLDYLRNRSQALTAAKRHSLGWEVKLELDEFPLEIQCQSCFWWVLCGQRGDGLLELEADYDPGSHGYSLRRANGAIRLGSTLTHPLTH